MHSFERKLITTWRKLELPFTGETLIIAVSGGADSSALLAAIATLKKEKKLDHRIIAAHFDHGLRETSGEDAKLVADLADRFDSEFVFEKWRHSPKSNIEQQARQARYAFLIQSAIKYKSRLIFTAHTINDQAETFLLNLIRGSGIEGLSAIRPKRKVSPTDFLGKLLPDKNNSGKNRDKESNLDVNLKIEIIRPLLEFAQREDTENYCRHHSINYTLDKMNDDLSFTRVWIRKKLIPLLSENNPKIVETLGREARLFASLSDIITLSANNKLPEKLDLKLILDKKLPAEQLGLIRLWLSQVRGNLRSITNSHLESILRLALSKKSGRLVEIPGGNVTKSNRLLSFAPSQKPKKG
jgi:tRNA(Ile)-lysidine synthase